MKTYILKVGIGLNFLLVFSSCQKEIQIDLNSKSPQLVVEAEISDQPNSCKVKLTKTVNFSQSNNFPTVSGALVRISDDFGNSELLTETSPGIYVAGILQQGISGRNYLLEISYDGQTYMASYQMKMPTIIDTLKVQSSFFGNTRFVNGEFMDSAGIENYYRLIQIVNGIPRKDIYVLDDYIQDGQLISFTLFSQEDSITTGDSVLVLLQGIDKGVYEYFRTLSQLSGGGGQSATPANPLSNINNGALGYFNAYAVKSKTIVVQ